MKKTIIVTAYIDRLSTIKGLHNFDSCIAADGGYLNANKIGLAPDVIIGDFDSSQLPKTSNAEILALPMEKDFTDTEAALDLAIKRGSEHVVIIGGLGRRFDHTLANLGILAKYYKKLSHLAFMDGYNYVYMLSPGSYRLQKKIYGTEYKYLGVSSYSDYCENLSIKGCKYPLEDYTLPKVTSLGASNEIISYDAEISFSKGEIIITHSND